MSTQAHIPRTVLGERVVCMRDIITQQRNPRLLWSLIYYAGLPAPSEFIGPSRRRVFNSRGLRASDLVPRQVARACRQAPHGDVVPNAFAAVSFSRASGTGAWAVLEIRVE